LAGLIGLFAVSSGLPLIPLIWPAILQPLWSEPLSFAPVEANLGVELAGLSALTLIVTAVIVAIRASASLVRSAAVVFGVAAALGLIAFVFPTGLGIRIVPGSFLAPVVIGGIVAAILAWRAADAGDRAAAGGQQ